MLLGFKFYYESELRKKYSLKNSQSVILMYSSQIDYVHSINRGEASAMVSFENLFGECDHFLNWDVELAADPFEDSVDDVKVDD